MYSGNLQSSSSSLSSVSLLVFIEKLKSTGPFTIRDACFIFVSTDKTTWHINTFFSYSYVSQQSSLSNDEPLCLWINRKAYVEFLSMELVVTHYLADGFFLAYQGNHMDSFYLHMPCCGCHLLFGKWILSSIPG